MATNLPKLPDITQLSPNVIRILGGNPSKFTLQGTNTYLLGSGSSRILLDTAQGFDSFPPLLKQVLVEQKAHISTCLLTHWHHDHLGGIDQVLEVCSSIGQGQPPNFYKATPDLDPDGILAKVKSEHDIQIHDIRDGDTFPTSTTSNDAPFTLRAFHCPGHTTDHMSFIVTSSPDPSDVDSIFTGDNVLGHGTAVFENLAVYLQSLATMKSAVAPGHRAYPAHGEVIDDAHAKIEMYIEHRRMRENEALNVLRYGTAKEPKAVTEIGKDGGEDLGGKEMVPGKEWGSMEMVKVIYADVPENLHEPAERGLLMVLEKLRGEGKVVKTEGGRWRVGEKAGL